jgi:CheY-like chemotaxis protein
MQMTVLHIEDDENDVCLVRTALQQVRPDARVVAVPSVAEAEAYLEGKGEYSDEARFPLPDFIILDLKLPGGDGFDFLAWRARTNVCDVPVVAFTSSLNPELIQRALKMGAQLSFRKPVEFEELAALMEELCRHKGGGYRPRP